MEVDQISEFGEWWLSFRVDHPEWVDDVDLLASPPTQEEAVRDYPELDGTDAYRRYNWMTSYGVPLICLYYKLRRHGSTHRFAEMISCQNFPAIMTDAVFFQGMPQLQNQFVNDTQRERIISIAKQHGYTPGINDIYEPGLARFQGDPEAFVSPTDGRGYIKRICEKRGWACEGAVKADYREPETDPHLDNVPLAEDIVQSNVRRYRKDPVLAKLPREELRRQVIEKHGRKD